MVRIRLKRGGSKKRPFYRIIAVDSRQKRDGKALEILGYFNPIYKDDRLKMNDDRIIYWYKNGARASNTVYQLMKKAGIVKKIKESK